MSQNTSILSKNDITEDEKRIYNAFLIASKKAKNKPFRLRQNFTDISDEIYISLKKLGVFFNTNQTISCNDFFWAPYEVYSKEEYFDLSFYHMRKAIIAYSQYMRKKETQDPDNELTIQDCKDALKNIYNQCLQNSITLSQYKTSQPPVPLFLINLKSHLINFYILHGLDVEKQIKGIEPELLDFYCKDFYDLFFLLPESHHKALLLLIDKQHGFLIQQQSRFLLKKQRKHTLGL
jgi:hypothetical protein